MKWFKIDGKEWKVRIFEPEESFTVLYGENTGRTLADGAPMVLDPLGTFFNYTLTVGKIKGQEKQFDDLWEYLSAPRSEGVIFTFPKNRNTLWATTDNNGNEIDGFYAYVSTGKRKFKKIIEDNNGELKEVIYDTFAINFIAMKAQVLPE